MDAVYSKRRGLKRSSQSVKEVDSNGSLRHKRKKKHSEPKMLEAAELPESTIVCEDLETDETGTCTSLEEMMKGDELGMDKKFSSLSEVVSEKTLNAVTDMGFTDMMEIQHKSIRPLLDGKDLMGAARTVSEKTLAFLIPAVELMYKLKFLPQNDTGVVVISPTRELSLQTYGVTKELLKYHHHTLGIVMGGANCKTRQRSCAKVLKFDSHSWEIIGSSTDDHMMINYVM
ncbi:ATP-dependent RNA helicase DDX18-like [Dysidea avara]|uniref:ATP-dependent RNA helicase DDX18-like n=1 Tax=Dysidea avara TaxID=196820 RepID=UPI003332CAB9